MIERWVAAVWLVRALEGGPSAPVETSRFEDVDAGQWWAPYVERLAELGVTRGCATEPDRFCPNSPVTRGQMATFLARALRLEPVDVVGFIDVAGNRRRENIGAAAAAGIVQGCPTGSFRFCPGAEVTRGEMAVSLASALDLIAPLPAAPVGRFAFTSAQGNDEIFVMDADGSNVRRLTDNDVRDSDPVWSPDGTRIAFESHEDGYGEIVVMDADGANRQAVTNDRHHDEYPVWSPDGTQIAYTSNRDRRYDVVAIDADGSNRRQLTDTASLDFPSGVVARR